MVDGDVFVVGVVVMGRDDRDGLYGVPVLGLEDQRGTDAGEVRVVTGRSHLDGFRGSRVEHDGVLGASAFGDAEFNGFDGHTGRVVVGDGHADRVGLGHPVVAVDGMRDLDRFVVGVVVFCRRDSYRLCGVPVLGREGQRPADVGCSRIAAGGRDRDGPGRTRVEHDGVGRGAAFTDGEFGGFDRHARRVAVHDVDPDRVGRGHLVVVADGMRDHDARIVVVVVHVCVDHGRLRGVPVLGREDQRRVGVSRVRMAAFGSHGYGRDRWSQQRDRVGRGAALGDGQFGRFDENERWGRGRFGIRRIRWRRRIRGRVTSAVFHDVHHHRIRPRHRPVPADRVGDHDRHLVVLVLVLDAVDGEGPRRAPLVGLDGYRGRTESGRARVRRGGSDGDVGGGLGSERDGVGCAFAFVHGQLRGDDVDAR